MSESHPRTSLARTIALPDALRDGIAQALARVPEVRWIKAAQALSERYRSPRTTAAPLASGPDDALGYAALIMPAAYAQLRGAIAATAARAPGWSPATILDIGSGPGTALWAAAEQWPTLQHAVAWEREPALIALGKTLATNSPSPAVRAARWERHDLAVERVAAADNAFDLLVLGHVLNELGAEDQARTVAEAWRQTAGVLLIVEPGTPAGFAVVRAARDALLADGGHTLAPCAHDAPCPLADDWCHFPQRIWRPEFQRRARGAPSPWEESKFAYAAIACFPTQQPIWGRIIREPTSNKAYAEATISSRTGIVRQRALKRHREEYRRVQNLTWGETLDDPLSVEC
jgi:ribosomal protein RSM22 (predicted rRNA methylase)